MRLAAHLTGYRIDIKSASEFEAMEEADELGGFAEEADEFATIESPGKQNF